MATSVDQKNFVKTALRLPPELHAAVHASAQKAGRSYNAELVFLIEKALTLPTAYIPAPPYLGTVDADGKFVTQTPKELMASLTDILSKAYRMAQIFKEYEDGDPDMPDISGHDEWLASRGGSESLLGDAPKTPKNKLKRIR